MSITLLQGDCREVLATLPERSVQCCVTSPPYFGLRRYDVDGAQIGLETTPAEYVQALVEVFRGVRRVLRDDGVLWVNLGDSYSGSWGNYAPGGIKGVQRPRSSSGQRWQRRAYGDTTTLPATARVEGIPEKNLLGIPWRVAFALQDDGWILRSDIIWHKPNPMPESVTDRPTRAHEYLFLFAKSPRYFYDAAAIAEAAQIHNGAAGTFKRESSKRAAVIPGQSVGTHRPDRDDSEPTGTRNKRTVWTVSTRAFSGAHFAVFPEQLIEPCILAGSAAQACEHCGAPWERVVERERLAPAAPSGNREIRRWDGNDTSSVGGRTALHDLGFLPTCQCPNEGRARSVVLDPFVGSGTTCRVAERFGRDSIGIDLGYQELQEQRTDGVQVSMEAYL